MSSTASANTAAAAVTVTDSAINALTNAMQSVTIGRAPPTTGTATATAATDTATSAPAAAAAKDAKTAPAPTPSIGASITIGASAVAAAASVQRAKWNGTETGLVYDDRCVLHEANYAHVRVTCGVVWCGVLPFALVLC